MRAHARRPGDMLSMEREWSDFIPLTFLRRGEHQVLFTQ